MIRDPMAAVAFHLGDCRAVLATLPVESVQCVVTSPPYWQLRAYETPPVEWADGWRGELGLESQPSQFVAHLVEVFEAVKRVLRPDGVVWCNLSDSYSGGKIGRADFETLPRPKGGHRTAAPFVAQRPPAEGIPAKNLLLMPHRVALALQEAGWWVRAELVWAKMNPMPESVEDRPTRAHEMVFMLTRAARYYYDGEAVRARAVYAERRNGRVGAYQERAMYGRGDGTSPTGEAARDLTGRNLRSVLALPTEACSDAHFATFPRALVRPLILAGTSAKGACPACGSPWRRVVERERLGKGHLCPGDGQGWQARREGQGRDLSDDPLHRNGLHSQYFAHEVKTTSWTPTCPCPPADPVPCVVLDPFCGSGTVGAVAAELGRRAVLIDAKEEYIEMAKERVRRFGRPRRRPPEAVREQLAFAAWEEQP